MSDVDFGSELGQDNQSSRSNHCVCLLCITRPDLARQIVRSSRCTLVQEWTMASDAAAAEGNAATGDGGAPVDLLIAAVPAVGALGAMAIAYWVYHFSRPAGQGKKRRRRRRQPTKNEYQTRTSHLDTSGSVLAAWETTPSDSMLGTVPPTWLHVCLSTPQLTRLSGLPGVLCVVA